jgi:hypothetical protein
LLDALIVALAARGVRRVSVLLPDGEAGAETLGAHQFARRGGVSYHHRELSSGGAGDILERLGGRYVPPGLFEGLARHGARESPDRPPRHPSARAR